MNKNYLELGNEITIWKIISKSNNTQAKWEDAMKSTMSKSKITKIRINIQRKKKENEGREI